jgi:hypothetical protein
MAGKATVFANRGVFYAMDGLTKNTLIDFVVDIAIRSVGDDKATDENILQWVQDNIQVTDNYREQKSVNLLGRLERARLQTQRYLAAKGT